VRPARRLTTEPSYAAISACSACRRPIVPRISASDWRWPMRPPLSRRLTISRQAIGFDLLECDAAAGRRSCRVDLLLSPGCGTTLRRRHPVCICSTPPGNTLVAQLELARQTETQSQWLDRDIRTLTQWLSYDVLTLAGPVLTIQGALFAFTVDELEHRDPGDERRIRPVHRSYTVTKATICSPAPACSTRNWPAYFTG
jgi:hypothetical protein